MKRDSRRDDIDDARALLAAEPEGSRRHIALEKYLRFLSGEGHRPASPVVELDVVRDRFRAERNGAGDADCVSVRVRCRNTQKLLATTIRIHAGELALLERYDISLRCPHCGADHRIRADDAVVIATPGTERARQRRIQ